MIFTTGISLWVTFILLSIFFSGMEEAFIASDKLRYAIDKKSKGIFNYMLNTIYGHPRQFMVVLTTANLILLTLIVYYAIQIFYPIIDEYITASIFLNYLIIIAATSLIILLSVEFIPGAFFRKNPNMWVKILVIPIFIFYILLYPVAKIFISISKTILYTVGVKVVSYDENVLGRTELDTYVKQGIDEISSESEVDSEVKIFRNALDFSSMRLKDCMVPRADIIAVSNDTDKETLKQKFIETGLSRILVYEDNIDDIIGYIHIWEMFNMTDDWNKRIASLKFVPESMSAHKLMGELMQEHKNLAVVIDEFGGTSGIVTLEDLVEEIFGEIEDEYDVKSRFAKKEKDNEFVLSGRIEIDQVNEMFGLELPESDDYTTIAGFILHHTQRFPKTYETITIDKYTFNILKVTARKIEIVRLIIDESES